MTRREINGSNLLLPLSMYLLFLDNLKGTEDSRDKPQHVSGPKLGYKNLKYKSRVAFFDRERKSMTIKQMWVTGGKGPLKYRGK